MNLHLTFALAALLPLLAAAPSFGADPAPPTWSLPGGITVGLHPSLIPSPRGVIRLGHPLQATDTTAGLLNFIAVEPVTRDGRRGLSELERSPKDGQPGLIFWSDSTEQTPDGLRFTIRMEKFSTGAHPYLVAELRRSHPREVRFSVHSEPDSAPMERCILSATMGNLQRLRYLEMADRVVPVNGALRMDPGAGFTPHAIFPLDQMKRDADGAIVRSWGSEDDPAVLSRRLPPPFGFWAYGGRNFVQYWRQPEPVDADLRVAINARKTYWMSEMPIPGGKAIENFELSATFREGQTFIWGLETPDEARLPLSPR